MDLVVINTGGVLDSVEFVEFSLHQLIDGFDFCVRREPLSYYDVIMIHRRFQVVSTGQILYTRSHSLRLEGTEYDRDRR